MSKSFLLSLNTEKLMICLKTVLQWHSWHGIETRLQLKSGFFKFSLVTQLCPALCDPMDCSMPGFPVHHQLPELAQTMSIELVMPSNHLILRCPLLLLPSILPSLRVFSNESFLAWWAAVHRFTQNWTRLRLSMHVCTEVRHKTS